MAPVLDGPGLEPAIVRALGRFRLQVAPERLRPLAGDVGQRRYFRIEEPAQAAVLVLYPDPFSKAQAAWATLRGSLERGGVRVPGLLDDAPDIGAALVEDLGDHDLSDELEHAAPRLRSRLLDEAEEILPTLRRLTGEALATNPPFDGAFFQAELDHTRTWALERGGQSPLEASRRERWDRLARELAREAADPALTGSPVPTHRDFHSNNLMRALDGRLAVIDFQDLRLGPPDYDPVSLRFERAGESVRSDPARYRESVLLQRAWKVLGTFEKMLARGREVYRPHRDTALQVIRRSTRPDGPFAALLEFLPEAG